MGDNPGTGQRSSISAKIILPSMLSIILFVGAIFWIILPALESQILERKREMIRKLTQTTCSTLSRCYNEEKSGALTRHQAQAKAVDLIRHIRYGQEMKDYFWINDMHPRMIMHPYRPDLEGKDLTTFSDPNGKRLFDAFVDVVKKNGEGYVDYMWQWKDDPQRIVPKLSYVKVFRPWQWIVGTGIYLEDVKIEIGTIKRKITLVSLAILGIITMLSVYIICRGLQIDAKRKQVESKLKASEERLKTILNAVQTGVLVIDAETGVVVDANPVAAHMMGRPRGKIVGRACRQFSRLAETAARQGAVGEGKGAKLEKNLLTPQGKKIPVLITIASVELGGRKHYITCFFDISDLKKAQLAMQKSEEKFRNLFNNAQVGLFRTNVEDGTVLECNDRFAQMFGFNKAMEVTGASVEDYYLDRETRPKMVKQLRQHGVVKDIVARFKNRQGNALWVRFSARLYPEGDYMEGVVIDITEQKRTEAELKKHVEALSLARETARAAQISAESERDRSALALKEVSEGKRRLEVLLSDSSAREKRMVELKREVNTLLQRLNETAKYEAPGRVEELLSESLVH